MAPTAEQLRRLRRRFGGMGGLNPFGPFGMLPPTPATPNVPTTTSTTSTQIPTGTGIQPAPLIPALPTPKFSPADVAPDSALLDRLIDTYLTTLGQGTTRADAGDLPAGSVVVPGMIEGDAPASGGGGGRAIGALVLLAILGAAAYFGVKWWRSRKGS